MLSSSLYQNYFDIDSIGALEESVPVSFLTPSFALGSELHLTIHGVDPDAEPPGEGRENGTKDAKEGQSALLPLWAAEVLYREGCVRVATPPSFGLATFREFKGDPLASSLADKSPYFYEAGMRLSHLVGPPIASGAMSLEGGRLAAQLIRLYQLRYLGILRAGYKRGFDLTDLREKLTESERWLLDSFLRSQAEEQLCYGTV